MFRLYRGVTLIELLVVVAVISVVSVIAIPSFSDQLARRKLEGAANELATDLQFAKSKCVSANLAVSLATNAAGTAYTISSATETFKAVSLDSQLSVDASAAVAYTPLRGFAGADTTLTLTSNRTPAQLRVAVTTVGKVSMCSPGGSFKGYTSC